MPLLYRRSVSGWLPFLSLNVCGLGVGPLWVIRIPSLNSKSDGSRCSSLRCPAPARILYGMLSLFSPP